MGDKTTSKTGRTWLYVVGLLVAAPLCYLMSCGPAAVLCHRGMLSIEALDSAYAPVVWLQANGYSGEINAYVWFWLNATGTKI